jgi:2-hydroxy-6-oxonona-2,4-dienedioate hydrolase
LSKEKKMPAHEYESIWSHLTQVAFCQGYVDAGGVRTRYIEAGDKTAPTVVFIHGIGGSWEAFCANIGPYSEHFHVLALDNLGSGFTAKPEQPIYEMKDYIRHLKDFLDVMGVDKTSLVGVSMGGWNAINFAHTYPDRVEKIVLCAASGLQRPPNFMPPAAASISNDRKAAIENPTWENISRIFEDLMFHPHKRLDDFIKLRQTVYRQPEMKDAMKRILAITPTENFNKSALSDDEWREVKQPVLLLESLDDSAHFRKNTVRAQSLLPNARTFQMKEVAHWPPFEDPETFNMETIKFLLEN